MSYHHMTGAYGPLTRHGWANYD